jgi:2-oxoglutarate/2-oxoacid ferredoxin oxidoreductase subunit alpha
MSQNRLVIKFAGESGQGVNSLGALTLKSFKKIGYNVFGYREYPSLIRGGNASYQIDIGNTNIRTSSIYLDFLICLTRKSVSINIDNLRNGGVLIHNVSRIEVDKALVAKIEEKKVQVVQINTREILKQLDAPLVMENAILMGILWKIFKYDIQILREIFGEKIKHKPHLIEKNNLAIEMGYGIDQNITLGLEIQEIISKKGDENKANQYLITGNDAIALGGIRGGMRAYYSYPMTPASTILTYFSQTYKEHGAVVKQAEDEITAAQMALGSMYAGTRALTGTSGGGFDLMTETLTMSAMNEIPFVCVLAQRPGPATGMPTWTAQGDLNLALYSGHGEYPRCVIAVSDPESAFSKIQIAFNIAEIYQMPVILLTDKYIAESVYLVSDFDTTIPIKRGIANGEEVEIREGVQRYQVTDTGISPRWLPGTSSKTYISNSDEHVANGRLTEDGVEARIMMEKRLRKLDTLKQEIPEPEYFGPENPSKVFVGWGSTKWMVLDILDEMMDKNIGYVHYEYIWPLKTNVLEEYSQNGVEINVVEQNATGQFATLINSVKPSIVITDRINKYDGRPFFYEEILEILS